MVVEKEENYVEAELLDVHKLYVGKVCYHAFSGVTIEKEDYDVVGTYDVFKSMFYDELNFKEIPVWDNRNQDSNKGKYLVHNMLPLHDYLEERGYEHDIIERRMLRKLIEPLEVKDPVLKRIVSVNKRIEDSFLPEKVKEDLKLNLLNNMNEYVDSISKRNNSLFSLSCAIQNINHSLNVIESMIPGSVDEIKSESAKLRMLLFSK